MGCSMNKYFKNIILINFNVLFYFQTYFGLLSYSAQATITKCHRLGRLNNRYLLS